MEKSSHHTEGYDQHVDEDNNIDYQLYDDAWRSEDSDATSLLEVPLDYLDNDVSECEDTIHNAITEVSNDFLSGKIVKPAHNKNDSDESHSDAEFKLITGLAYSARYPETAAGMSDNDWNPYGTESDTNMSPRVPSHDGSCQKLSDSRQSSFNPPLYSTDLNVNTPSVRMCSISDTDTRMGNINEQTARNTVYLLEPDITTNFSTVSNVSEQVMSLNKPFNDHPVNIDLNKTIRVSDPEISSTEFHTLVPDSSTALNLFGKDNSDNITDGANRKHGLFQNRECFMGEEYLAQRVQNSSPDTQQLGTVNIRKRSQNSAAVIDYDLLQQDLQDIQDSLRYTQVLEFSLNGQTKRAENHVRIKIPASSDSECDIIPSTTTTPDGQSNKMVWDFAADLGYDRPGDLMGDISLETHTTNSCRPSDEKKSYNSDGDETRTSGSSDKIVDHAAADQALAEMSQIPHTQGSEHTSYRDVDLMLFNFRNQRQQIETRYQQLNDHGLAEKVNRILSSQDPQSQANGILSEIRSQEREMNVQFPLYLQGKDFNFSTISSHSDESCQSLALPDNVRKRLDLSGLSSTDVSKLADKSYVHAPVGKGFTAVDGISKFLSSQMAKALERTFNHSMEKIVPHRIVQCYPLTSDNKPQERTRNERFDGEDTKRITSQQAESAVGRFDEDRQVVDSGEVKQMRSATIDAETGRIMHTDTVMRHYTVQNNQNQNSAHLPDDSDSSSSRRREKYRPYRPAGSKEVYYTESDVASVADSVTTMESTHFGSDDARAPVLPASALGSRQDAPNVAGIYGNRMPLFSQDGDILPPIQEKSGLQDERETESNQSYKGDKTSESLRAHSKDHDGSSGGSDRAGFDRLRSRDDSKVQDRHGVSREDRRSAHVHSESTDAKTEESPPPSVADARSITRWANFRNQNDINTQKWQSRTEAANINQNIRLHATGRNDQKYHIPPRSRVDEFESAARHDEDQLPSDHYRKPTETFVGSEYYSRPQKEPTTELFSSRSQMIYDNNKRPETGQRYDNTRDLNNKEEVSYSVKNGAAPSSSRLSSAITGRSFNIRFGESEKQFSSEDPYSLPEDNFSREGLETLPQSHSDENLYNSTRGAHISPLFHHALTPDLRHAIRSRSPILSHHIERSLSVPPADWSDHRQMDVHRSHSLSPTFLARENGQTPAEHTAGLRRTPVSSASSNRDRPWSPLLQVRVASPSSSQDDMEQPSRSLNPAESRVVAAEYVSPHSHEAEVDRSPVSKRVQRLTQALTHEQNQGIQPDIGSLWEQFKANNESNESTLSSANLDSVTDLLFNPSPHLVAQCLKKREEHLLERQEKAETERENRRTEQRQERHRFHQSSSEEEMIAGLLAEKEMERMKRRMARKKKGKPLGPVSVRSDVSSVDNIADKLFSIPEDASFEQSPKKSTLASKFPMSKVTHQPHIIDPNMEKLRERISKQKQKIDKNTFKEIQRVEKLKKLELLLSAKRNGEISDRTLEMQLEEISSTSTPGSDNSQEGWGKHSESRNTTPLSDDSTTAKDSSNEMLTRKAGRDMKIRVKPTETRQMDKHRPNKTNMDKHCSSATAGSQVKSTRQSVMSNSQSKLLKLVKEGYLTADEAYRLAVEREALEEMSVLGASSSDEFNSSQNSRLHKLYSPYSRNDSLHRCRYVPKLKSAPSVYGVTGTTYPKSLYKHNGQSLRNLSAVTDHNDSHPSDFSTGTEYNHQNVSQFAHSHSSCRERSVVLGPSSSRSVWQKNKKASSNSPARLSSWRASSHDRQSPAGKSSSSRHEHVVSPTRARSSSPQHKERTKQHRHLNKRGPLASSQYEKTCKSENEPPLSIKTPESGGVAWHIPIVPHRSKLNVTGTNKGLPLQEQKAVNNTLPKKTLQIEEWENQQRWPNDKEVEHDIWHKVDHPQGIPNELWKHIVHNDALASKSNHWEVDPLMDRVQYILNKHTGESGTEDEKGSLSKLSLQEAFLAHKQGFISKCKERQKRLALACDNRRMQEYLRLEREALFLNHERIPPANLNAHPYSDNLYQPRRRLFSKQEMKDMTLKRYKKLPEVVQKQELDRRTEQYKLNRLRVNIFNMKVQRDLLRKKSLRLR